MSEDKWRSTLGTTDRGSTNLAAIMETGWFDSEMSVYLVAISTAIARQLSVSPSPLSGTTTKYNVGTLDKDGRLRALVQIMGPPDITDPYEFAERLADTGLDFLKERLVDQERTLSEVLFQETLPSSSN